LVDDFAKTFEFARNNRTSGGCVVRFRVLHNHTHELSPKIAGMTYR